ncbi:MAG: MFS transporter [Saprospiraceae bacterium]|jgi:MFS family permease|nr:MFS transporter [Saprospiraceae bacterium]
MPRTRIITRNIWILSLVSLMTDVASEMLYPVMPVYLKTIGFSIVLIGVLEGFAEAAAGLSKGYFGNLSDAVGRRLPFVQAGYAFSAISKPMMAAFVNPLWIFFARAVDRLGKGIRTGARDALLSDEATPATKGRVFGFHRAMDTLGAVTGPLLALVFLSANPGAYRALFLWAFVPGVLAIAFTLFIREKRHARTVSISKPGFLDFLRYWRRSPVEYRRLAAALLLFTLFNSSDVFLLLKIKEAGLSDTTVIGIYIFYNLVYALAAYPLGIVADRLGMKRVFAGGLLLFAAAYAGMAFADTHAVFIALFFLYGLYAAATEGVAKAWISNICEKKDTATAIGTYTAFQSICALLASSLAGLIWYSVGPAAIFGLSAVVAVLVAGYVLLKNEE